MRYELRVVEDRLASGGAAMLPAAHRVVYVVEGQVRIASVGPGSAAASESVLAANQAWYGPEACRLQPSGGDAVGWRWELAPAGTSSADGTVKVTHEVELDSAGRYLVRCDRVDFPLGGVAYTHTHRGPGIRVLLQGRFRVEVAGHTRTVEPGQAWFESGPDPVYATASETALTSFVRVMILPAELQGRSSIQYVKPEDQDRPKSQRYTVFLDTPIAL